MKILLTKMMICLQAFLILVRFQSKDPDFLFMNLDLLIRNLDFRLKNVVFIIKQSWLGGSSSALLR